MSLVMLGIHKAFGQHAVLSNVDFSVENGEVRALIGENGAGKTTLMNILGGVLKADRGITVLDNKEMHFQNPRDAMNAGVAFIHQELNLVNDLCVYENLFIGRELRTGVLISPKRMIREARAAFQKLEIELDPCAMVRDLDASYKQIVEIVRALMMNARILIMDEPTTSLTEKEIERVFQMIRSVREQGVSVVFISHKLQEIKEICDTYTVLRDGRVVSSGRAAEVTVEMLARDMVGHDIRTERLVRNQNIGQEVLRVQSLRLQRKFEDISFVLRAGEILGCTGLLGDGRSELFQTIFGVHRKEYTGRIFVSGKVVSMKSPSAAYRAGIGYVPRDRKENGIMKDLSIVENGTIVTLKQLSSLGLIQKHRQHMLMKKNALELSIKMESMDDLITSLSGGNQQKVVLSKWLNASPKVLIFDNPTQGVDVGAKEEIYAVIMKLAEAGVAVVILSSEAQEIMRLCDRTLVMYHGKIQGELAEEKMSEHAIMRLATGGTVE